MYSNYERPPFPIKVDVPSYADIFREMRFSDLFMFGTVYTIGNVWAFLCARKLPVVMQRLVVYHAVSHLFTGLGMSLVF